MEYVTVQEAAAQLKVAPITIRRYISQGRLAAVKVGRVVRIEKDALDRLPEPIQPESRSGKKQPRPKVFTMDDPFWQLVGSIDDPATDVSTNKYKYLAEAYAPKPEE